MKIERVKIINFKNIRSYEGDIHGKHVYISGANQTGKTSFIDAIWLGLTGKNCPPEPVTKGQGAKGLIELDLGDFIARTKFRNGKPLGFELENKTFSHESEKFIKSPRTYMENRIGVLDFNINEFFSKSDQEQVKYFSKIMGVDFSDIDIEIDHQMENRKFDKKKLSEIDSNRDYITPGDENIKPIDVVEISKEIEIEKDKLTDYESVKSGIENRSNRVDEINSKIAALLLERDGGVNDNGDKVKGLLNEINGGELWLKDSTNIPNENKLILLREKLENSTKINERVSKVKDILSANEKYKEIKLMIDEATQKIAELKQKKAQRISEKINIEGLEYSVDEGRFLWGGLPFDPRQINTADQLISGMKIGSAMLRDLKILKVDASLIDKDNFDKVLEWADDNDIELFVELVDREGGKLEIVLQDKNEY